MGMRERRVGRRGRLGRGRFGIFGGGLEPVPGRMGMDGVRLDTPGGGLNCGLGDLVDWWDGGQAFGREAATPDS